MEESGIYALSLKSVGNKLHFRNCIHYTECVDRGKLSPSMRRRILYPVAVVAAPDPAADYVTGRLLKCFMATYTSA